MNLGSSNPDRIYMFNGRIGYISGMNSYIRKTTNSGINWTEVNSTEGFSNIKFTDSLTGWKNFTTMKKTTDGGLSWILQPMPSGGIIINPVILNFSIINSDTLWGCGGAILYPNSQVKSILYRTTNGGSNWLFQIPDTSVIGTQYRFIQFTDHKKGWAYGSQPRGIHTKNGGDSFFVPVEYISSEVPGNYKLHQNYPNPFNPKTKIRYQIIPKVKGQTTPQAGRLSNVKLEVFDIQGKQIAELVNQKQTAGTYEVDFSGVGYSSGVYFYSLIVDGSVVDTKKMLLIK